MAAPLGAPSSRIPLHSSWQTLSNVFIIRDHQVTAQQHSEDGLQVIFANFNVLSRFIRLPCCSGLFSSKFGRRYPKDLGFFDAAVVMSSDGYVLSVVSGLIDVFAVSWMYFTLETIQIFTF